MKVERKSWIFPPAETIRQQRGYDKGGVCDDDFAGEEVSRDRGYRGLPKEGLSDVG